MNSRLIPVFIDFINSHERVIPDWDIRASDQISITSLVKGSSISSEAESLTFRLSVISKLALYFARKKVQFPFPFVT